MKKFLTIAFMLMAFAVTAMPPGNDCFIDEGGPACGASGSGGKFVTYCTDSESGSNPSGCSTQCLNTFQQNTTITCCIE